MDGLNLYKLNQSQSNFILYYLHVKSPKNIRMNAYGGSVYKTPNVIGHERSCGHETFEHFVLHTKIF